MIIIISYSLKNFASFFNKGNIFFRQKNAGIEVSIKEKMSTCGEKSGNVQMCKYADVQLESPSSYLHICTSAHYELN